MNEIEDKLNSLVFSGFLGAFGEQDKSTQKLFKFLLVKNPPAMRETWVRSLVWEDPLEKEKTTHSSFWPGEFHGLYSPWGLKELDMTEQFSLCNMKFQK